MRSTAILSKEEPASKRGDSSGTSSLWRFLGGSGPFELLRRRGGLTIASSVGVKIPQLVFLGRDDGVGDANNSDSATGLTCSSSGLEALQNDSENEGRELEDLSSSAFRLRARYFPSTSSFSRESCAAWSRTARAKLRRPRLADPCISARFRHIPH